MLFETRKALRRNGRFDPHMAYAGYRAEITVKFFPAASFIPPVEQTVEVSQLSAGNIVSQTATVEETIEVPVRPPNQVRVESDMPTPVLTQDQNGNPIEKWVRRDNKPPKNTVKGNGPAQTMVPTSIPPVKADADRERLAFPTREK